MAASGYTWDTEFTALYEHCVAQYRGGQRDFTRYYSAADSAFLKSIGCQPREFFDFIEDYCDGGDLSPSTALLVAAARRDYFLHIQQGHPSATVLMPDALPARDDDSIGGIRWLRRILAKARAKLRGEMPPTMMYCCGGDRSFFKDQNILPAEFLALVWRHEKDDTAIIDWVVRRAAAK